ncbi:MAG TPA: PadR family transcriptional regulator [Candidatus Angelobacter sp.]|jgi:DNA-binding PadR family transcriptional regulator|nr:PadR family transcriptional regulator [Candidatus Angelobacter sp.]
MRKGDSSSKFAILGALSLKPASGYDIKRFVASSIGHFWNESYGSIYPILKKLAHEKLIQAQKGPQSGRDRVVYAITQEGEKALREWLLLPPRTEPFRSEILLKLFFARRSPANISATHIQETKLAEERRFATYAQIKEQLIRQHVDHPELPYWLMTLSYGRHRSEAVVAWCNETLSSLAKLQKVSKPKRSTEMKRGTK